MSLSLSLGLGLGATPRGGASLVQQLVASSATLAVYDWTNPAAMTAGAGGPVSNGSAIALVPNAKTPGTLDLAQPTGAAQPIYNGGAIHDGTNDFLLISFGAGLGPANVTLLYVIKTTDTQFMLSATNSATFFSGTGESGVGTSPDAGVVPASYLANGAAIGTRTRAGLQAAWATGAAMRARVDGANFQNAAISDIRNQYSTGAFPFAGNFMPIALLNVSDANYAAALALAEAEQSRIITAFGL